MYVIFGKKKSKVGELISALLSLSASWPLEKEIGSEGFSILLKQEMKETLLCYDMMVSNGGYFHESIQLGFYHNVVGGPKIEQMEWKNVCSRPMLGPY